MPCIICPGQQDEINRETKAEMLTGLRTNFGELGLNLTTRLNKVSLNPSKHLPLSELETEVASLWQPGSLG